MERLWINEEKHIVKADALRYNYYERVYRDIMIAINYLYMITKKFWEKVCIVTHNDKKTC